MQFPINQEEVLFHSIHNSQTQSNCPDISLSWVSLLDVLSPANTHRPNPIPLIPRASEPIIHGRPNFVAEHP